MAESRAPGGGGGLSPEDVLPGRMDGRQRTKTKSNMIRVFISSTFTDMSSERRALLEKSYPEIQTFCRGLGLVFEVVDLRWGIRSVPSGDHEACEIFLQEIQTCQRVSAGPAFVALLGNRYGHRALPRVVPEKLFQVLLSKLSENQDVLQLLSRWFLRDANAAPPSYVLQPITAHFPHYADLRPESGREHDRDVLSWRDTENQLLDVLRSAATRAEEDGDITSGQKRVFYTSVTEQEFEEGLWKVGSESSSLVFVREVPRQRGRDGPKRLAKLLDVTANGLLDVEAQRLLTGLKARLYDSSQKILSLHCVELQKGSVDPARREHAQYLDSVCEQFVSQMKARIAAAVDVDGRRGRTWGSVDGGGEEESEWLVEDGVSAQRSGGLHGREGLLGKLCLAMWESGPAHHRPLVVHGAAGMGKTALLCRLAQEMRGVLDPGAVVAFRPLAARHPHRPDVDQVLRSVCLQVCLAWGLAPPSSLTVNSHLELVRFFGNVLAEVSQKGNTLLIILDSVDQLSDQHHAHKLRWLPAAVPPNVHLVVSMDTHSEAFASVRMKLETVASFFEVERLTRDEVVLVMESYLRASRRTLTSEQSDAVLQSVEQSGCPLHLHLILSNAKRWTSSTPRTQLLLGATTQEVMSQLFLMLEEKHGKELVGGALGYIALAREGLLEAELRDVMSLDDDVMCEVYRYTLPPTPSVIRLPPLLWARLRWDLQDQLEERWTDGVAFISFNTRRLSEAAAARYLTSERRGRSLKNMAEYFLGRWAGKLKPASLPGLTLVLSDRKVPPQPLWFAPGLANVRKLQELPYHLLHAGLWEELQQEVIGCAEWLYCKSQVSGISSVIQDLDQCSRYMDCAETGLIRDALVLMKPSLDFLDGHMDMSLFYTELLARLSSLTSSFPALIGRLCSQCEEKLVTSLEPILIPKSSFLQPPGGALQHTLAALQGGVVCMDVSAEAKLLAAGADDGAVAVWSLDDQQLLHFLLGHTASVLSVRLIDSPAHCLSLAADGSLRRWSLINGQELLCIQEAVPVDSAPSSVHLHLSEQLVFVYNRTEVKVWRPDGAELHLSSSSDPTSEVLGVLGQSVFSLCESGRVRISDPADGTQTETELPKPARRLTPVASVSLARRGRLLLVSKEGFLHQVSSTGEHTATEFPLLPSFLVVSEDEKVLLAGSDRTLSLFNVLTDSVDRFLDLQHDDSVLSACVSSDGRVLVSGASDQLIRIWSVTTGALMDSLCGSDAPVSAVMLFGGLVVSASAAAPVIHLWSLKYDTCHKPTAHIPAGSAHVTVTKDADRVFYVHQQNQTEVRSWDCDAGSLVESFAVSAEVCFLDLAQHKRLLLCGLTSGTVLIYPLALPLETLCIPPPENLSRVLCLSVSAQEKHLAVAYEDSVSLFEITTRDSFPTVDGPVDRVPLSLLHGPVSCMALLPDLRLLYGTGCGAVRLQRLGGGGACSSDLEPHRSRVTCVTAGNWGRHALVGSEDAVQRLWALDPLVLDHTMEYKGLFFEGVLCAAFSDSDKFVFTGSQDRTIKVWDVASGVLLYVQYVYSPVVRMVTYRNGFVALTRQGSVIREVFRCPDQLSPDHNPLRNVRAQYRVTSRDKNRDGQPTPESQLQDFNPAQFNLNLVSMLRTRPSSACVLL